MTTITLLDPSNAGQVGQFLRIYQSSIEPSEQKTAAQMAALVADARYRILVSLENGTVSGFAMSFVPSGAQFVLLEYMAVDAELRSCGIGAALLEAAADAALQRSVPLLLEVDQPGSPVSPGNDPARRLRFYAERGCNRLVGLDYILPLATNGTPPAMWLLLRGRTRALSHVEIRDWLTTLYVEVYAQSADDPRIDAMLSGAGDRDFALAPVP
ncbi:MAG: GNAT family N-acetyltransferase [Hyphomicrobiaceae bacterium]|nr:GNAT family N-acetyltransferase [Hyphomicrobiaceae bacterium]